MATQPPSARRARPLDPRARDEMRRALFAARHEVGSDRFLRGPILEPADLEPPSDLDTSQARAEWIADRLLEHVGLVDLPFEVGAAPLSHEVVQADEHGEERVVERIEIEVRSVMAAHGEDELPWQFLVDDAALEAGGPRLVAALAEQTTLAFRRASELRPADGPDDPNQAHVTGVALGLGVLFVAAASAPDPRPVPAPDWGRLSTSRYAFLLVSHLAARSARPAEFERLGVLVSPRGAAAIAAAEREPPAPSRLAEHGFWALLVLVPLLFVGWLALRNRVGVGEPCERGGVGCEWYRGHACARGFCRAPCTTDADCARGEACTPDHAIGTDGYCMPRTLPRGGRVRK